MKNSLLALALMTLFVLGCGLDKLASRSGGNTNTAANANASSTTTSSAPVLPSMSDVDFAREALTRLTNGDTSAGDMVDWDNFKVMTIDVGAQYRLMPDETNRKTFRDAFIPQFSSSFKSKGADLSKLSQWKEVSRSGDQTVVSASAPGGTGSLLITVSHPGGAQKLAGIDSKS
jgi:hypothetical protein